MVHIYIYIVIHRQTSVWLDTQDASNWNGNPSNFTLDMVSNCSAIRRYTLSQEL